ncbi:glycosyltransferase [Siminovitchia fortis]|uniref:glycosyltransferase n=1 Tax=Siminovitchia fortis TaxID=254758 RepID=UPI0011A105E5|nr:glycosyltransferase [Siminovitchia fortis]
MNDYAVYFMLHSIEKARGGLTRAAIQRADMLSRLYHDIGLITFDFNPDYDHVIKHYQGTGLWSDKIKHFNVYEFLMNQQETEKTDESIPPFYHDDFLHQHIHFDLEGRPRKVTQYDQKNGKPIKELLLTKEGKCFFERCFQTGKYNLLDRSGNMAKSFKTVKAYRRHFIQSLIENREAILLSDSRFTDKILMGIKNEQAVKIAVLHSNHLQSPYEYGSTLVKRNELLFDRMNQLDAVVTLTESQAKDIASRFGRRSTIHTVGHPAFKPGESAEEHDPYTAVMLVRYEGIKQIPHAIKAFKRVVKKVPEAKLEIWGFGREEERYRRLIKRLRIENHVFIKGFTHDVENTFRRAAFSLITSKSEAFGMSIIESMSVGTPVICYACKYGPTDIITHEKNGLLIEPGDIKALADAMTDLFSDKEKRRALSKEAKKIIEVFGDKKLEERWKAIFEEARKQSRQRVHLEGILADITNMALDGKAGVRVEGRVSFKKMEPAFRHRIVLFLQLRRRKEMEDVYAPLSIRWESPNSLIFKGRFSDVSRLYKGCWDVKLSVSCLNFHQFVQPMPACAKVVGRTADLKICARGQRIFVKVYRPKKKRPINFYFFLEKSKAKIRDRVRIFRS